MVSIIYIIAILYLTGNSYQEMPYFSEYTTQPMDQKQFGCGTPPDVCPETKYRSYDGSCNNLKHPVWGMEQYPYQRLVKSNYEDGIYMPALAKSGKPLTNARTISVTMYPDKPHFTDPKYTLAAMQYGQLLTHDVSFTGLNWTPKRCCTIDGHLLSDPGNYPIDCMPIIFPYDVDGENTTRCMDINRTLSTLQRGCNVPNETINQITVVTGFVDLSNIYGNSAQDNRFVRNYAGGRMKVVIREGHQWPPEPDSVQTGFMCPSQAATSPCYMGGDNRANQHPEITVLQIVWLREHNRLADELALLNPHWDDETLFQETRRITIAQHQQIAHYEYLPVILGTNITRDHKITYETSDYVDDYDEDINPTASNEYATGAFRYFHAAISGKLALANEDRNITGYHRLSNHYLGEYFLEKHNNYDNLIRGFTTQPENFVQTVHTREITEFLFKVQFPFIFDLKAIDVHRSRDHGLASYNDMREFCGLPRAKKFHDFSDTIKNKIFLERLVKLYECPDDVDFIVGGSVEEHVPGTISGPTFLCILIDEFLRARKGDRFWFEHSEQLNGFTRGQLKEIRNVKLAKLLCNSGNNVASMQLSAFELISNLNPVIPCDQIPSLNLSLWKENLSETC